MRWDVVVTLALLLTAGVVLLVSWWRARYWAKVLSADVYPGPESSCQHTPVCKVDPRVTWIVTGFRRKG